MALRQQTVTKTYTRNQYFWEFGGLSLRSQTGIPTSVQNNSGYDSADPPVNSQSLGAPKFFVTKSLFHGEFSWNNLLEYWHHKSSQQTTSCASLFILEWNSTRSIFIQEHLLSLPVICVIFWSRLSKKVQHLKTKSETSLQWNQGIVTCFNNVLKWAKP